MAGLLPEAQKSLNRRFERGERVWDWIRLLRSSTPDDRQFRNEVVNAFTGLAMPKFQAEISEEHLGDVFSILDENDWFLLANSKWIFRYQLPKVDLPVSTGPTDGLPAFKFPNMHFKAIPFQNTGDANTEARTVTLDADRKSTRLNSSH